MRTYCDQFIQYWYFLISKNIFRLVEIDAILSVLSVKELGYHICVIHDVIKYPVIHSKVQMMMSE